MCTRRGLKRTQNSVQAAAFGVFLEHSWWYTVLGPVAVNKAWVEALRRCDGPERIDAWIHGEWVTSQFDNDRVGSVATLIGLANRVFEACGERDVVVDGRRYVMIMDGDLPPAGEIWVLVDRRYLEHAEVPAQCHHVISEHAQTIGRFVGPGETNDVLDTIWLPSVRAVEEHAFLRCSSLRLAQLPNAKSLSFGAFSHCSSMVNLCLPLVQTVDSYAFDKCKNLKHISLPSAVDFGYPAFFGCTNVRTYDIPAMHEELGSVVRSLF